MSATTDTFNDLWRRAVDRHGGSPFLLFRAASDETTTWTYAEFDEVVSRVSGTLAGSGVRAGAAVHLVLRNSPAFVALWLAAARLGARIVPVDPASAPRDIRSQVRRVRPVVSVVATARLGAFRQGAGDVVPTVLDLTEDASDVKLGAPLLRGVPVTRFATVGPDDGLAVMFTSGTTSEPKGVELTHANYVSVATAMAAAAGLKARHRWFVTLPLFHANAQYYCFSPAILMGASVALTASFSASGWVPTARLLEVTHASLFAAPIRMILARCPEDEPPLTLEHVWFAQSLGAEHHRAFGELAGTAPRQLYGMTETVAIVTADTNEPPVHDVIGPPIADRQVRLVTDGQDVADGVPGEIWVRGVRGRDLFAGYLDAPEINARAFTSDGDRSWFHTGDLAVRHEDGALRFVGRVDDVIKVSGENVSLTEIEAAAAQAPGVLEVAVVAQADPVRDHVPVAYVVARDKSAPPTVQELEEWAAHHLAAAARPRAWYLIDELPRTSVGKVRRFRIPR
ncbi:class I adenylate-forming enzyme family protein [Amycolatopsis sp. NBC_01480]|uniref:class I adenylate-forming enzyme family protein n=1 Tax=Amycolatopsis sp. NBC_01480 TaxID=2903562 RepID=UPI002E2D680A|nr:class I adenylate-forming enzyme family protein [Amycolatopsis sp. NBC_01480]